MQSTASKPLDQQLLQEFLAMGFSEAIVRQALSFTSDREKAMELILDTLKDEQTFTKNNNSNNNHTSNSNTKIMEPANQQNNEDSQDYEDYEEDFKMVFVARTDLGMGLGKMAAQVGHATIGAYKQMERLAETNTEIQRALAEWMELGQKKIVVKADSEAELLALVEKAREMKINHYLVRDAGRTQIKAGSVTVCGFGPAPSDVLDKLTGHLKLM